MQSLTIVGIRNAAPSRQDVLRASRLDSHALVSAVRILPAILYFGLRFFVTYRRECLALIVGNKPIFSQPETKRTILMMFNCKSCKGQDFESGFSADCMECRLKECRECMDEKENCVPCSSYVI